MQKAKRKAAKSRQPPVDDSVDDRTELPTMDEDVGKDFGTLVNAPLSKGGHFVFKSEKTWTIDSSQYSEFFTLNLKALSAAINCIPFNEYADVPDSYFLSDQLTSIHNDAERGKAAYSMILDDLNTSSLPDTKSGTKENTKTGQTENLEPATNVNLEDNFVNLEKDLDFLLSLKEPIQINESESTMPKLLSESESTMPKLLSMSHNTDSKTKSKNVPSKPIDLEKWLDSVLDD